MVPPQMQDTATSIHVKLEKGANRSQVVEQVLAMRGGLKYQTWEDALGVLKSMTKSFDQIIVSCGPLL